MNRYYVQEGNKRVSVLKFFDAVTIQAFVKNEAVKEYKETLDKVFGEGACAVLKVRKYGGVKVL